ncbi:MAG TPA: hypothetical protein VFL88_05015 [Gemmatimonadales bacterium]|nr:hypothetical protein [Gemmatimonadales bacterium]
MHRPHHLLLAALLLTVAGPLRAQESKYQNHQLNVMPLAGQKIAVLPITYVVADPAFTADSAWGPWSDRVPALRRADSLVDAELVSRSPEINWVLPPELRKISRRAGGMLANPDEMGQAMLRNEGLKEVPDNLAAPLRKFVALAGGRMVLVPAALGFSREPEGSWRADLALVLVDARRASVVWRSLAVGRGSTPDLAAQRAAASVFP